MLKNIKTFMKNNIKIIYEAILLYATAASVCSFVLSIDYFINSGMIPFLTGLGLCILSIILCKIIIDKKDYEKLFLYDIWKKMLKQ